MKYALNVSSFVLCECAESVTRPNCLGFVGGIDGCSFSGGFFCFVGG